MKRINLYINTIFEESEIIRSGGMVFGTSLIGSFVFLITNLILLKHSGPEVFIGSNILTYPPPNDPLHGKRCKEFIERAENDEFEGLSLRS